MKHKFKSGDKVKIIRQRSFCSTINYNKIVTINAPIFNIRAYTIKNVEGGDKGLWEDEIELYQNKYVKRKLIGQIND